MTKLSSSNRVCFQLNHFIEWKKKQWKILLWTPLDSWTRFHVWKLIIRKSDKCKMRFFFSVTKRECYRTWSWREFLWQKRPIVTNFVNQGTKYQFYRYFCECFMGDVGKRFSLKRSGFFFMGKRSRVQQQRIRSNYDIHAATAYKMCVDMKISSI